MRKHLLFAFIALLSTLYAHAYDFKFGDLYYNITGDYSVQVTKGDIDYNFDEGTSLVIPEWVTRYDSYYAVTGIERCAFQGCTGLTSISLPKYVMSIGEEAFKGCTGLTSITIPEGVTSIDRSTFNNCTSLVSVTIPNSVKRIGHYAFMDCTGLTSINIPDSVTYIGEDAFFNCTGLLSITIPKSVTTIEYLAFYQIPNIVYSGTATGAPWGAKNLNGYVEGDLLYTNSAKTTLLYCNRTATEIIIPGSVTTIGKEAFRDCDNLTSVTIPNSVTSIGYMAFYNCASITSLSIPNNVTEIGAAAFEYIPNIVYSGTATGAPWGARNMNAYAEDYLIYTDATKTTLLDCSGAATGAINIPNTVTTIMGSVFSYSTKVTSITIPSNVTSIGGGAFGSGYYWTDGLSIIWNAKNYPDCKDYAHSPFYEMGNAITSFVFGDSVQHIPAYLCCGLHRLTTLSIPENVTSIGQAAFFGTGLFDITIPDNTYIGYEAFYYTPWYDNQPDGVTYIGHNVYDYKGDMPQGTYVSIKDGTTTIGEYAFSNCANLAFVTIPNSVTTIRQHAFDGCSGITSITIPNSVTTIEESAFDGCSRLTSIAIPNGVATIGKMAFRGCSGLTSITIPNGVKTIEEWAFAGCTNLLSITIPNSVTTIGENAFYAVPNIMYSGTAMGAPWGAKNMNAYRNGNLLYTDATKTTLLACNRAAKGRIIIPSSVTTISDSAFYNCQEITSVMVPNSVTRIGKSAFSDCTNLTSITIPNGITSIEYGTFEQCEKLTSITIPNSVTSIGEGAFFGCESLTSIAIPSTVTSIKEYAFASCVSLTSITIPNGVTSIGESTFSYCVGLTSINIPNSITSIGWGAFYGCESLTSITIPKAVTSIGEYAFSGCGLTSVTIPNNVTSIEEGTFSDCKGLESVTCQAVEPLAVDSFAFKGVDLSFVLLYVPAEATDKYTAAEVWKDFMEIKPIGATPVETDKPILNPEENKVTITWPAADNAATYTIEICKAGTLICTLTFDANGVLQSMRFAAPSRHATQHTAQAEATNNGFRFVVEGLDYATTYAYSITSTDKDEKVLTTYSGTFTTTSPGTTTDADNLRATQSDPATRKVFRNGQLLILRGDKAYTTDGQQL